MKVLKKIIVLLFLFLISYFIYYYINYNDNKEINEVNIKKENTIEDISYYIKRYKDRYTAYKEKYNYSDEKTVLDVNMNLDYDFYDDDIIKTSSYTDGNLILINKYNKVDKDFIPALVSLNSKYTTKSLQVTNDTKHAFEKLCEDSLLENLNIKAMSAYKSYDYQLGLYNYYVSQDGKEAADKYSARPGFSEHNSGLAIDIKGINTDYLSDETKEYKWIKDNAHLYGFIIRYPKGNEDITGYQYEPWHLRYVGIDVATYIYEHNITFDEYYAMFLLK